MSTREELEAAIERVSLGFSEDQRRALRQRLAREATRLRAARLHPSAGALARSVDHTTVQTPALDAVDAGIEYAIATRGARVLITMPPQEGKSTRVSVWGAIRAMQLDPERRIVLASYADQLAQEHSRTARNWIDFAGSDAKDPLTGVDLPDRLGLSLAADKSAAGHWRLAGHRGGMYVAGIQGGITGRPAELLIIDDPIKDLTEADQASTRKKVIDWWNSVATTRLAPGAPVILVQTRWHEDDLAGYLLKRDALLPAERRLWRHVNVPAIAEAGVPDALGREVGQPMLSARGRTHADWALTRDAVGPRVWGALYQGAPTPTGGGLFSPTWFQRHRLTAAPPTTMRLVSVDPAETGKRDEVGLVAMGATPDGRVVVTDDWSERMTSERWTRQAVLLALTTNAHEVTVEAYTAELTYVRAVKLAWRDVRAQARLLRELVLPELAAAALAALPYPPADPRAAIREVEGLVVPDTDDPPFRVHPHRGKGDKVARATGTRQAASIGRLQIVGSLPLLEAQAEQWQLGQGSPDRVDALVNGYERLIVRLGGKAVITSPADVAGQAAAPVLGSVLAQPLRPSNAP